MPATDRDLIEKCKQGSIDAFEQVVNRYQQYAFKIAYGILGNVGDAEDMVQEAFITVHRQINSLREGGAFPTWLGKIVTNLCLRKIQKGVKISSIPLDSQESQQLSSPGTDQAYLALEAQQDVHKALLSLPLDLRVVVVLRDLQGYSYNEIAKIAGIPVGTVKSRIHQARTLLADRLSFTEAESFTDNESFTGDESFTKGERR